MGTVIKAAANKTLNFFGKIGSLLKEGINKVAEVVVNGVKKVVSYFKKIIEYSYEGVKIVGKLLYALGKQLVHTLTFKKGIPYLIEYYNELKSKGVTLKDEHNTEINPNQFFNNFAEKMNDNDQIRIKAEIVPTDKSQEDSIADFKDEDDAEELKYLGLTEEEGVAKIGENEINLDNISNADTVSEDNI